MAVAVLVRSDQPVAAFGHYLAEILHSEGLSDLTVLEVDDALPELDDYDAVVLTRMNLTRSQRTDFLSYLRSGGHAVIIRPAIPLALELGLRPQLSMTDRAYVRATTDGVPQEPIQTHVTADNYAATGETNAELYGDAVTPTAFQAVLTIQVGDGRAIVFTYDLPRAVSLIRQGDPDRVGGRALGNGTQYRNQDLLIGFADPACWHLPQADIHAMLLGNAINTLARNPQPRWWYYPTPDLSSVVVLDSDDDWSKKEAFEALIDGVEQAGGHVTIYLMLNPSRRTIATPEMVEAWRARGHSFGIHHNVYDESYDGADEEEIYDDVVRSELADFRQHYGDDVPIANRNHCAGWKGYVEPAKLYAELGIKLDLNTMSNGTSWLKYLTGSGRPMRFVDSDGTVIDCFQQLTRAYDDLSVVDRLSGNPAGEAAATRREMEECVNTYFSPMSMLSHPVSFHTYSREYQTRCWAAAGELGMPIWSAFEWADFVCARDEACIVDARWDDRTWSARLEGRSPQGSLTIMLPAADGAARARVDGEPAEITMRDIFGCSYAQIVVPMSDQTSQHDLEVVLHG